MAKTAITTDRAPRPAGGYSQAIRTGRLLFIAGQVPFDPDTGALTGDTIEAQTARALDNIGAILEAAGASFADVVKVNAYLADMALFDGYDAVYRTYFPDPRPARATVGANLVGFLVEIDAVAEVAD